ncbi:MAG: hypothetical protein A2W26_10095 [Acidobacteria bacterium RBG_16_64_8]|nr:MAG: hypothetical protein A2W26_10095 [Acidobacteria bacterium RBG_16_64_8]
MLSARDATRSQGAEYAGSYALFERAGRHLAGGVSTAFRLSERPVPLFVREATGAYLVDVDGRRYVDYTCGFGPVILGHGRAEVATAVAAAAERLQQVGAQHKGEGELAELLCAIVPAFELVRFSLTGSEAIHAAIRLARAATGRPLIVKFHGHYHGWFDEVLTASTLDGRFVPASAGQLPEALAAVVPCAWNNVEAIDQVFAQSGDRIAAVIMEPIPCNHGVIYPTPGFLQHVRKLTESAGALLIFDEVITGFRLGLAGAQGFTGTTPDLAVVAKAMANGFPISAFGGRREIMELVATNSVMHAGTFNGNGISVAAALATIQVLQAGAPGVYDRMGELGGRLARELCSIAASHGHRLVAQGPGPVFWTWFLEEGEVTSYDDHLRADSERYARFAELMLLGGVRVIGSGRWYLTAAHDQEAIDHTLAVADRAFGQLR